jgi:hypothetical protein
METFSSLIAISLLLYSTKVELKLGCMSVGVTLTWTNLLVKDRGREVWDEGGI